MKKINGWWINNTEHWNRSKKIYMDRFILHSLRVFVGSGNISRQRRSSQCLPLKVSKAVECFLTLWRRATWWCLPATTSRTEFCGFRPCTGPRASPTNLCRCCRTKPQTAEERFRRQRRPSVSSTQIFFWWKLLSNEMLLTRGCLRLLQSNFPMPRID